MCFIIEIDGLVWWRIGGLPGETPQESPKSPWVMSVGNRCHLTVPGVSGLIPGEVRDGSVEFGNCWVSGIEQSGFVSCAYQVPDFSGKTVLEVFLVPGRDGSLGSVVNYFLECLGISGSVGCLAGPGELRLSKGREEVPVCFPEVGVALSGSGGRVVVYEVDCDWKVVRV